MYVKTRQDPTKIEIVIRDMRLPRWMRRLIAFALLAVVPIGIGILAESNAMQWIGFVMALLSIGAMIRVETKTTTFTTAEEAIAYLNSIK